MAFLSVSFEILKMLIHINTHQKKYAIEYKYVLKKIKKNKITCIRFSKNEMKFYRNVDNGVNTKTSRNLQQKK